MSFENQKLQFLTCTKGESTCVTLEFFSKVKRDQVKATRNKFIISGLILFAALTIIETVLNLTLKSIFRRSREGFGDFLALYNPQNVYAFSDKNRHPPPPWKLSNFLYRPFPPFLLSLTPLSTFLLPSNKKEKKK